MSCDAPGQREGAVDDGDVQAEAWREERIHQPS